MSMFRGRMAAVSLFLLAQSINVLAPAEGAGKEGVKGFGYLSSFTVPGGGSAEIVSADPQGNFLVYSSAVTSIVGVVDITNPALPELVREITVDGQPTSVAVAPDGEHVFVAVITTQLEEGSPPVITPGKLLVLRLSDGGVAGSVTIGTWPDSVVVTEIGGETVVVVAIENQPIVVDGDGNFVDDDAPGNPSDISEKGLVQVIRIDWNAIDQSPIAEVTFDAAALTAAGLLFPDDPQPEYTGLHGTVAAVTLQENNGVAIIDLSAPESPELVRLFSSGVVANRPADLTADELISFTEVYPADVAGEPFAGTRMSDAIAWNAAGTALFTADEGELDFTGGRGWSAWSPEGAFLWDDGGELEVAAVAAGQYPEGRSDAKGIEAEGLGTGVFGGREFAFVTSERGGFVGVYDISLPALPRFVQILSAGVRPEGVLALPGRNLVAVSNEGDEGTGSITIFQGSQQPGGTEERPRLRSSGLRDPFGALSGLAVDPHRTKVLYSVPDNALLSTIYRIDLQGSEATLRHHAPVTINGVQAVYDLEGIVSDTSIRAPRQPGFWLASEGNGSFGAASYQPNLLIQVDAAGRVLREIRLPVEIDPPTAPPSTAGKIGSNGFEGVTISSNGRYLLAAIQRELRGEVRVGGILHTRIGRYDLVNDTWEFFLYPLEAPAAAGGFIGLSEITNLGSDVYAVIERDNQVGSFAEVKRIYVFSLQGVTPFDGAVSAGSDLTGHVIQKALIADILDEFAPFEKIEGLALLGTHLWASLDNDGGEFEDRLVDLGDIVSLLGSQ